MLYKLNSWFFLPTFDITKDGEFQVEAGNLVKIETVNKLIYEKLLSQSQNTVEWDVQKIKPPNENGC